MTVISAISKSHTLYLYILALAQVRDFQTLVLPLFVLQSITELLACNKYLTCRFSEWFTSDKSVNINILQFLYCFCVFLDLACYLHLSSNHTLIIYRLICSRKRVWIRINMVHVHGLLSPLCKLLVLWEIHVNVRVNYILVNILTDDKNTLCTDR